MLLWSKLRWAPHAHALDSDELRKGRFVADVTETPSGSTDRRASSPVDAAWRLAVLDACQFVGCPDREADSAEAIVDLLLATVEGEGAELFRGPIVPGVGIDRHELISNSPLRSADPARIVRRVPRIAAVFAHHDAPVPFCG